jgi:late competence protein required for DNA uptake (superfamily II DNA/RNA helicase)
MKHSFIPIKKKKCLECGGKNLFYRYDGDQNDPDDTYYCPKCLSLHKFNGSEVYLTQEEKIKDDFSPNNPLGGTAEQYDIEAEKMLD